MRFSFVVLAAAVVAIMAQASPSSDVRAVKRDDNEPCNALDLTIRPKGVYKCRDCTVHNTGSGAGTMYAGDNGPAMHICSIMNKKLNPCVQVYNFKYCKA
jgi:hypothetical protein